MDTKNDTTITTFTSIQIHLQYAHQYLLQNKPNLAADRLRQARHSLEKFHNATSRYE